MRFVEQQLLSGYAISFLEVVAKPVGRRLKRGEGVHIRLLLRRVAAARGEANLNVLSGVLGGLLECGAATQDDQVSQRHPLVARLRAVELVADALEGCQHG